MSSPARSQMSSVPTPSRLRTERQRFLWTSSQQHAMAPALARLLLHGLDRSSTDEQAPLPLRAIQRCCGGCLSPLAPGFNCRITQAVHLRRPAARRRTLRVHCERCGHVGEFPLLPRPRSRTAGQHPDPPKAPQGRKPEAPAAQHAKRKRPTQPSRAPVATTEMSAGDSLFGFDFVPL